MTENQNEYFSSVFTRGDISALPVPETKFEGRESDKYLMFFGRCHNVSR